MKNCFFYRSLLFKILGHLKFSAFGDFCSNSNISVGLVLI